MKKIGRVIGRKDERTVKVEFHYIRNYEKYSKKISLKRSILVHDFGKFLVNIGELVVIKPSYKLFSKNKSWFIESKKENI